MFRRSRKQPLLGLDISSTAVKLIELSRARDGYRVEAMAIEPLPERAVQDKSIMDPEAVGAAIRRAVKESGTHTRHAVVAIPGSAAVSRVITVAADLNEYEIEEQVRVEADQYIPYSLDEVNLDFTVIGPTPGNPGTVDVLLAASRTENIDTRVAAAELGGLQVDIVDIEPFAVENAFLELLQPHLGDMSPDAAVALFDMGSIMTGLSVFQQGKMIYTREHPFGTRQHVEEVMRRFDMSLAEAERAIREGSLPESYGKEVLEPFLDLAAQQASRFLQLFYAAHPNLPIMRIMLGGGIAAMPHILEHIADSTHVETIAANPLFDMSRAPRVPSRMIHEDATSMLIACGLALRSFD